MGRLKINFTKNNKPIEFTKIHSLVNSLVYNSYLKDDKYYHNSKSDYSISSLYGGIMNKDGLLDFPNGSFIIVTSNNEDFISKIVTGSLNSPDFGYGMKFKSFDVITEKFYNGYNYFATLTPFIIKEKTSKDDTKFVVFDDTNETYNTSYLKRATDKTKSKLIILSPVEFSKHLTIRMKNKLIKINPELNLKDFKIEILPKPNDKIKRIMVHDVVNYANQCNVKITSNKTVADMIYNLGLGQSTGCGFGTIYKTENHKIYRNEKTT
jgi:CRISPR-associated endoribonuclease Cas6